MKPADKIKQLQRDTETLKKCVPVEYREHIERIYFSYKRELINIEWDDNTAETYKGIDSLANIKKDFGRG